ncbi:uncharacterized protein LOC102810377 [Saccoglossus kowalevskii]|uniref:Uncharacterized protein LOC102810377 n=1 Tax=Saccoglossus kowalevskii TaxID=10224 RepID=A0ABM0M363_SACKO|nr:PREDICTED: uncharacterized protein LOC102810377 [Saccoglossus kowalevskii]
METLIVGDSILQNIKPSRVYRNTHVRTLRGSNVPQVTDYIMSVKSSNTTNVVLHVGTNDIDSNISPDAIMREYNRLTESVSTKFPEATIYVSSILPRRNKVNFNIIANNINARLQSMCDGNTKLVFIHNRNISIRHLSDEVHLNDRGTALLVRNIKDVIGPKLGINRIRRSVNNKYPQYYSGERAKISETYHSTQYNNLF